MYLMLQFVGEDGNGAGDHRKVLLCHGVAAVGSHTQCTPLHEQETETQEDNVWCDELTKRWRRGVNGGEEKEEEQGERREMGYPSKFISLIYFLFLKFYTPILYMSTKIPPPSPHPAVEMRDSPGARWRRSQGREGMHSDHPRERREEEMS